MRIDTANQVLMHRYIDILMHHCVSIIKMFLVMNKSTFFVENNTRKALYRMTENAQISYNRLILLYRDIVILLA